MWHAVYYSRGARKGHRGKLKKRQRMDWDLREGGLDDKDFVRRYRLDRKTFFAVCDKIREDVEPNRRMSRVASKGLPPVSTEIMLSATLRYCAGGAWQDIIDMHGIGLSTFNATVRKVI